ncbi:hypothetical protein [Lysobacter enzymogenes]|uniref:hypothetical protein n=1 Tax=Lysobacter enzymogenes TaxID=69 RepID=UPI001AF24B0E|nr:hypothetical protein [Lysobacter enzymogenes]QQQ02123.1 hypothetical protein JHW41_03790 [Lysobacter enzymogenes]
MLTPSDFIQALRPAFIVYALAMASTGAALRFAPDDARQSRARTPAALHLVETMPLSLAAAFDQQRAATAARTGGRLPAGFRVHAGNCAASATEVLPAQAAAHGAFVAGALAGLP